LKAPPLPFVPLPKQQQTGCSWNDQVGWDHSNSWSFCQHRLDSANNTCLCWM